MARLEGEKGEAEEELGQKAAEQGELQTLIQKIKLESQNLSEKLDGYKVQSAQERSEESEVGRLNAELDQLRSGLEGLNGTLEALREKNAELETALEVAQAGQLDGADRLQEQVLQN